MTESIHEEAYQALINRLGEDGPVLMEKNFNHLAEGYQLKDAEGNEKEYADLDVMYRADDTYWSPLDDAERLTVFNITDYQIKHAGQWLSIAEWFNLE